MNYVIRGNNLEVTDALRSFIEKKISRLEKYFNTPPSADAHISLSVIRDDHKVEVTIPFPGVLVRAEEKSADMYASIDLVVEKLERQIRKYKTKINRKLRQEGSLRSQLVENENTTNAFVNGEDVPIEVVRTKRFHLKPMDVEEAIMQMELLGHHFFVFSNAETDKVNVVYRRKDGRYGLIEPE
ncbi:ribosome hibernation-promoting factor, HPF/YfiA family [Polycladomyces subterraneus]|uniref:Ribosome hibernation promoting factor n=1 Tax=Polycladomyces subterraneus TaxID=1016997 RepID=A0ABT8IN24_9BACL|nr:ribosome-associated translation inhibitor RaiA [Polycladomyces subterraneus]MDN4593777.1 ribosome-associated translation inhibitor RaiA [Polycladomyces subterraneus]